MIGIFDSGVGGFTVLKAIQKKLPDYKITYLADLENLPYGNKSAETILKISEKNCKFLQKKGANVIVIACNTASAYAYDSLVKKFSIPILDVIAPACELAKETTKNKKIGIVGTAATVNSQKYQKSLSDFQVFATPCPLLTPLIEEGWSKKPETKKILKSYLRPLKNRGVDTLILGCTHYPILTNQIKKIMGKKVAVINSADTLVKKLAQMITEKNLNLSRGETEIYLTDISQNFEKVAKAFLGKVPKYKKISI